MAGKRYKPCELRFRLENVILDDVSDETVSFAVDNRMQLPTDVLVDRGTGLVHVVPRFSWEEMEEYSVIFSKMLRFPSRHLLLKNYAVSFQIREGIFFSRNVAGASRGGELFAAPNVLRHNEILCAYFDENRPWITLNHLSDLEDEDEENEGEDGDGDEE